MLTPDDVPVVSKNQLKDWAEFLLYGDLDDEQRVITEIWNAAGLDPEERWK